MNKSIYEIWKMRGSVDISEYISALKNYEVKEDKESFSREGKVQMDKD